ncbi:hypothetical protein [Streptomyces griseomycini]|uniref:Uncharacterized protein n=1 Tax=Streptomyces griseomycini TaxID=66895 RepID=A0A7W7PWP2_9ACTN|nr:hypothetical protein [Streptomyces griseomycini]MBB4902606.1 hypothetical protein [Streptomyces griseomycini]GGR54419.1 hypothetical protein GCM10015536_69760 [Streptomyces griseomycini]
MTSVDPAEVIVESLGRMAVRGRTYPRPLPDELAPWHCYVLDGGHSILAVLDDGSLGDAPPRQALLDRLVPAPVRAVERAGWRVVDGFVLSPLPYDPDIDLVVEKEDEEFDGGRGGM